MTMPRTPKIDRSEYDRIVRRLHTVESALSRFTIGRTRIVGVTQEGEYGCSVRLCFPPKAGASEASYQVLITDPDSDSTVTIDGSEIQRVANDMGDHRWETRELLYRAQTWINGHMQGMEV
jgi:hypothetical protein